MLIIGASAAMTLTATAVGGLPAYAAASPRLPREQGRQEGLTSRYDGTVFDHVRVDIGGDQARLFIPRGIVPGSERVPVLWLYHGAGSSHDALTGGFRPMGERAVDLGMIAICQNLGGTLWTHPTALQHQVNGWDYLSAVYDVDRCFLRGTSHGGAMGAEVVATQLIPHVVGAYIVNGVYDLEHLYLNGSTQARFSIGDTFGYDLGAIRAHSPSRHVGASAWSQTRLRVVYSQPDSSDTTTPPPQHGKALIAAAAPHAVEASARTHSNGHTTPGFADSDNQATMARWLEEIETPPEPPGFPTPIAQWGFTESTAPFAAAGTGIAALVQGPGSNAVTVATPWGRGVQFDGSSDHLRIPAGSIGALNVGATTGKVTIAAWVQSTDTNAGMIAGCWQESDGTPRRAYALFNDLATYGGNERVCMNVSRTGGDTPGYPHSIDYAVNPQLMERGAWQFHVGTYDGAEAIAYLDGEAAPYPSYTDRAGATYAKNPYRFVDGINPDPGDFLVGASRRDSSAVNLHRGTIAGLRVWDAALTAEQVRELYDTEKAALTGPVVPGPIAQWDFAESAAPFASSIVGAAALQQGAGSTVGRVSTPFGGGVEFDGSTDFLRVPESELGPLNIGASTGTVTVAAWVYSTDSNNANIAGCWQESRSDPRRSYALFNDLPMYGGNDMVCMEVSKLGDATPGYPFSIDYAAEPTPIERGQWQFHVGTYDGAQAIAYLNGTATPYTSYTDSSGATYDKNPYRYPDGLNATPTDFMVGAVVRDGRLINLHRGRIARLRVWDRALTAEQIATLYESERAEL